MKIGIHQPNFMFGWFDHIYKLNKSDVFIVMINCQFEKNGFQNRANIWEKWWTLPVKSGLQPIKEKQYMNGKSLVDVNMHWILWLCGVLGIDSKKIHFDFETEKRGTERIIEICKKFDCDEYLTNPDAMNKYLDEKMMNDSGIEVIACETPHKKHILEMFNSHGIDGAIKLLNKEYKLKEIGETK